MLKNYLKIALRNIRRHKGYSFINIAGLAIGISCCLLMLMWVQDELSYDRFHENSGELSRVLLDPMGASPTHEAVSPPVLAAKMKDEFPEVRNTARLSSSGTLLFSHGDKAFFEDRGLFADQSFFEMFTFPFTRGDPAKAFSGLQSIVITEEMARKYFGSENPIGKTITVNKKTDYTVTGVLDNIPHNSHLQFSYVRPFILLKEYGVNLDSWGNVSLEFTKLVLIASLIAWPLAYFIMNSWLQNFVSRTSVKLETLVLSAVLALGIALLTVSYQSVRAAVANPVDSLRYE